MNEFRLVLALTLFLLSGYFVFDLLVYGFDWILLGVTVAGFISCHFIWPHKYKAESRWFELLEYVVDLPFQSIAWLIRSIGGVFKGFELD